MIVLRRAARRLARIFIYILAAILIAIGVSLSVLETGWAKNHLRNLIVRQANQYLTATLSIGSLSGSLVRGLQLGHVQVARDGRTLISIDEIALSYSIRELIEAGTVIRRVRLTRPRFVISRQSDGRWDIAAMVKRERQEGPRTGPNRPIVVQRIEITEGTVQLSDPLDFGAAHAPTHYDAIDAVFAFAYYPVRWRLDFDHMSWSGSAPDLTMNRLAGALGNGPGGWFFDKLAIQTPQSDYTLSGRVLRSAQPTALDLEVHAKRFAFQEWSGVLRGLKNIAVEAAFETTLKGPLSQLGTDIDLRGSGGAVKGHLTLDTTVPGWRGAGTVDVQKINLARWLNNQQRPSNITGRVAFDLALELGRHFPRGVYRFDGRHAMYMNYAADDIRANGQITESAVRVQHATARAYGAGATVTNGSIGLDAPFPFQFQGVINKIDLRNIPATVPVPRVESQLTFAYDVQGTFTQPFIIGQAKFEPSTYLGATIGDGTVGSIDTQQRPLRYSGEGDVAGADLHRFGAGLDVAWLRDPRYDGTITGHFRVDGTGTDRATMTMTASGRLAKATLFHGTLRDADVSMRIEGGGLQAGYDGRFEGIDPAIPFADPRWKASLSGTGAMTATVRDLLIRDVTLDDYDVTGSLQLASSTVRDIAFNRGRVEATLRGTSLSLRPIEVAGDTIEGRGSGTIALDDGGTTRFDYDVTRADAAALRQLTRLEAAGLIATQGRVEGPWSSLHFTGDATITQLDAFTVKALTINGRYDATISDGDRGTSARFDGRASFLTLSGQPVQEVSGTVKIEPTAGGQRIAADLRVRQADQRSGSIVGSAILHAEQQSVDLLELTIGLGKAPWRLQRGDRPPTVRWRDDAVAVTPMLFVGGNGGERITIDGDWRTDGNGALHFTASNVSLDNLQQAFEQPSRYGGMLDADATLRGTRDRPLLTGTMTINGGRVQRVTYQRLAGRIDYASQVFTIDLRLDQAPGVFLTAKGTAPLALLDSSLPPQPLDVAILSSPINLGLVEGLTDVVRGVTGEIRLDVRAVGMSNDPHLAGSVGVSGGSFTVVPSGVTYKNVRMALTLSPDRIVVDTFHLEDSNGRPLELRGSLGTHELRVGALEITINAQRFEILHNEFGRMQLDAQLQASGQAESPLVSGALTIGAGELRVDEILQRALSRPYATEATGFTLPIDAASLNPWQRLTLNLTLHVPNTLRLTGDNVRLSQGTPVGIGNIGLRVAGDLYLTKDPGQPMYVNGAFDTVSGTYAFQGRRFDVDPASSIIFHGDLNPELYVGVTREIQGVQTRVVVTGELQKPELVMTSVPPLPESDILSLIVFNTSTNQLTTEQQQDLLVRAGTLAAGFLAAPLVQALSNEIGLDILAVEPGSLPGEGPRVTIGQEIAPGLLARFSRQFGPEPYDEATLEYYLSKILRLRATFSDAQTVTSRSPFRRVERAGLDLLFFFSF
jgi:autotransporter translocation and assembly factor TamB